MNAKLLLSIAFALLTALASCTIVGCSLIGYLIGSAADNAKSDTSPISSWNIRTVPTGSAITVALKSSGAYTGVFRGFVSQTPEKYADLFAENRIHWPPGKEIPEIKETPRIILTNGSKYQFELVAYDINWMVMRRAESLAPITIHYRDIGTIESNGRTLTSENLRALITELNVPLYSQIILETRTGSTTIPLEEIEHVIVENKKNGAVIGFVVGLVVDAIVVVAITSSSGSSSSSPAYTSSTTGGKGSCPFVYSYDGLGYVLDSETFSGSIFKSLQRTDLDDLEHLAEVDGTCRLRVANELPETQYIDEIKLLVVDHPKEVRVIPSFSGLLHSISHPLMPISAKDFQNNDVLQLIDSTDDQWWISNPFGRDPDRASTTRDGLILEFQRPQKTNSVKLAFNVQNTMWATEVEERLLRLQGTDLGRWYQAMNSTAEYRNAFVDAVTREAMLSVSVWNGKTWSLGGSVWFVGPFVPKAQVVTMDIANIPGNNLKIRLESTAGLWMVNSVQADFTPDVPLKITELAAVSAVDDYGQNIRELLQRIDDRYYITEKPGLAADVTFKAPPRSEGMERSYVLKSAGYYTMHIPEGGTPQRSLVKSLGTEPGAFGSYSIRLLNNFVSTQMAGLLSAGGSR